MPRMMWQEARERERLAEQRRQKDEKELGRYLALSREILEQERMSRLVDMAVEFAVQAHGDQRRKYTNEPYTLHLAEVARLVREAGCDSVVQAAAWLHDVLEDTNATVEQLEARFGSMVTRLVLEVTDVSKPGDGNRAARKALDRAHLAKASPDGQSIKLADLISNTRSIVQHDPDFARVYLREKELLMPLLMRGNADLFRQATDLLVDGLQQLGRKA